MPLSRRKTQEQQAQSPEVTASTVTQDTDHQLSVSSGRQEKANELANTIESDILPVLDAPNLLFPVPVVAQQFGVSQQTARDALEVLATKGILTRLLTPLSALNVETVTSEHPLQIHVTYRMVGLYSEALVAAEEYRRRKAQQKDEHDQQALERSQQ